MTGNTGFKGSWLAALLLRLGARVSGIALEPPAGEPSLWNDADLVRDIDAHFVDIRDLDAVAKTISACVPETVFHLAAQPLVRQSYYEPVPTYATNVMGSIHVLEAIRSVPSVSNVVMITSDKVYADTPQPGGYREDAPLGGADPYAGSKACAELAIATYRAAFFSAPSSALISSARAGNVIGGGDYSADRIVPDLVRAIAAQQPLVLRHPEAVRPWQHVLNPLSGYVRLAERMQSNPAFASSWNFGPHITSTRVDELVNIFSDSWGPEAQGGYRIEPSELHETHLLEIESSRAARELDWEPLWDVTTSVQKTAEWYRDRAAGRDAAELMARDLEAFETPAASALA